MPREYSDHPLCKQVMCGERVGSVSVLVAISRCEDAVREEEV